MSKLLRPNHSRANGGGLASFDLPFFERKAELSGVPVILCRPWTRYYEATLIFGTSRGIETGISVGSMLVVAEPVFNKMLVHGVRSLDCA